MSQPKKAPPLRQVNPTEPKDIDQIVNEIDELEQGMGLSKPDLGAAAESEESLIRGLDELAPETGETSGAPKLSLLDDPAPVAESSNDAEGTLSLTVRGGTQVALTFEVDGRSATVSFKDGVLRVETADGAEFKIPLAS